MHAVVVRDQQLHWEEQADPVPGDTELLVSVQAAGINGADLIQRMGFYPAPPGSPPDIPGLELAGEVVAVGAQVQRFHAGDRVMALVGGGGQATMAVIDESHALAVPDSLSWPEAGGFPEVFSTAFDALFTQAGLAMGERALVTGAAGGVGTAGVQLATATGARVVATVRQAARHAEVAALGADMVIDPTEVDRYGPYDVVLELVGSASLPGILPHLSTGARVVVIGVGSGASVEINLLELMGARARIGGSTLRARSRREKADVAAAMTAHVLPLLANGTVRVPVCDTFAMSDATGAYERFAAGGKLGKVVLVAS
ncbi:MAG TPA: zinc-binding dehydrogenase [Acidimicrobiales bacterium]|nr:zinc-binding dehydrogenase [Acidimicrobiales bacterium]